MNVLKLEQGSDLWIEARQNFFCASDAAAMMGASKYKSRNQLLREKKTGKRETVDKFKQELFDKGHAAEALARTIIELNMLEDFKQVVCSVDIDGVPLLASLDGLSEDGSIIFEHKLFNAVLAENVSNGVLGPSHYWQLEQQLLVSGADTVRFVVSDGTEENWHEMIYESVPERAEQLMAGWKQFATDLETYEPKAILGVVTARAAESFPLVEYRIEGSLISSNIADVLPVVKQRAEMEMNRVLETDQDFADKENLNKATKEARAKLKEVVASAEGEFVSFSEFAETAKQIDSVLQKMQAQGEKQVKEAKAEKKAGVEKAAQDELNAYAVECNAKIKPLTLFGLSVSVSPNFIAAMKGKRSLESIQWAVDDVVAQQKIEIDQVMARVVPNQIYLREHAAKHAFLFADAAQIVNQETEPFQAVVDKRIAAHKEADELRLKGIQEEADRVATLKAENKVKGKELIASWETARKEAQEGDLKRVTELWDFIQYSNCDEKIFVDNFMEAHDIYDQCFGDIHDRFTLLKEQEAENFEPEPDAVEPEVVEPAKQEEEEAEQDTEVAEPVVEENSFIKDMSIWAKEYQIPQRAVNALRNIMKMYGV